MTDNERLHELVMRIPVSKPNFKHIAETGVINGSLLQDITNLLAERDKRIKELEAMIEQFTYYGLIHTVNGVVPADYDSHEDLIKKAKLIFQKQS